MPQRRTGGRGGVPGAQAAGQRTERAPSRRRWRWPEEKLDRVMAVQQAKIDDSQARNAVPLAATGRRLRNPAAAVGQRSLLGQGGRLGEVIREWAAATQARAAEKEEGPGPVRNITDPDSRLMPTHGGGFGQCCNAENMTSEDELIVATELTDDPTDMAWFGKMMRTAEEPPP